MEKGLLEQGNKICRFIRGTDSVCLMKVLLELKMGNLALFAVHVNHGLRS